MAKAALSETLVERVTAVTKLMPVHDLPKRERLRLGLGVVRGRGRPRTIEVPVADADDYQLAIDEERQRWIEADPGVRAVRDGADPAAVVDTAAVAISEEIASLKWERAKADRAGKDTTGLIHRRVEALAKLATIQLARAKLGLHEPTDGARLKIVVDCFVAEVRSVLDAVLDRETAQRLGDQLDAELRAWMAAGAPP
ncbi:MAG: hypothetical protein ABSF69_17770 [Polyangiaceae bacterium]|jgi:hypothetical protein